MDLFFYPLLLIFNLGFAFRILPLFYFGSAIVGLDFVSFHVLDSDLAAVGLDLVSFASIYSKVNSLKLYGFFSLRVWQNGLGPS